MRIETKQEAYRLYHSGAFGNRLRSFDTTEELAAALGNRYEGTLAIRYKVPGSEFYKFDIPGFVSLCGEVLRLEALGAKRELMVFSEQADDRLITIQGEVRRSENAVDLTFSTCKRPMRLAFKEDTRHAGGLLALNYLAFHMDPPSWENLWELLDTYDDAVVEFSCYERGLGTLGHNTIFWETRHF